MMSEEKKTDEVSDKTENKVTETSEVKEPEKQETQEPVKTAEEKPSEPEKAGKSSEEEKTETLKTQTDQSAAESDQSAASSKTGQARQNSQANGNGTTVPPVDHSSGRKEPEKKHHGIWKTVLMYVLVFLVAGCGAFAGSYAAEHVYHEKMEKEAVKQFGNFGDFGNMLPFGGDNSGDNSESESSGPALGIVIQQTDDGIKIVGFAKNGNAEKAGLKTGDIIKKVDGKSYDSVSEITSYISSKSVGDKVKVTVSRNGEEKTYSVKLVKKDLSSYSMPSAPSDNNSDSDDQNQPKALPGTDGENSQLQG